MAAAGFGFPTPSPLGGFGGGVLGGDPFSLFFGGFGNWFFQGLVSADAAVFDAVVKAINDSGSISFAPSSWWGTRVGLTNTGPGLWATVVGLALAVMLCCVILAAIQGAAAGEPMLAVRAVAVAVPSSMLGMVAVVAVTAVLVGAVDQSSAAVLSGLTPDFKTWFANTGGGGFMAGLVMFIGLVGAVVVWMELILRSGFIFLFVLLSPLALAVRVWPAMGGFFRRFAEIGVALIVSKLVIAAAVALGSAALAGGSHDSSTSDLSAMATGAGLMLVAAFAPFVVLRMVHGVEGALAHQGLSRAPGRAAMTAVSLAASGALIGRLAAGSGQATGGAAKPQATPPSSPPMPPSPAGQLGSGSPPPQPLRPGPGSAALPAGPPPSSPQPPPGPSTPPGPPTPPDGPSGPSTGPASLGSAAAFIDAESRPSDTGRSR